MSLSRCSSCQRHVLPATKACPFCGSASLLRGAVLLASALAVAGCDKEAAPADSGATTKSSTPDAPDPQTPDAPDTPDTPEAKPDLGGGEESAKEPVRAIYAGPPPRDDPRGPTPEKPTTIEEAKRSPEAATKDEPEKAAPEAP